MFIKVLVIRKEIRIRDRFRKTVLKFHRERDIKLYKKQRNKVNNMKKIAKENFENILDHILLENSSNPKTYWKIMKMLIKSNKGNNCIPPLFITLLVFISKSGRGTFSSSNFDTRLKYLFNRSHLSSSPYTISSKFSSL
jgi:hypothetical protein